VPPALAVGLKHLVLMIKKRENSIETVFLDIDDLVFMEFKEHLNRILPGFPVKTVIVAAVMIKELIVAFIEG
jgi:hypothetical protein